MTAPPAAAVPTARALRTHLDRTRRARRKATGTEERDWYTPVLAALVVGGLVVQGLRRVVGAELTPPAGAPHAGLLLGAVLLVAAGLALRAALALGPVLAGPAVRHWVLAAPVDRRAMLTPRYAGVLAACAVAGAGAGALAALAAGSAPVLWWAVTGAAAAIGIAAAAVVWQAGRVTAGRTVGAGLVAAGAALAAAALVVPPDTAVPSVPAPAVAAVAGAVAAVLLGCGWQRLGRLDRAALGAGSGLAAAVRMAGTFLDPGLLLGLLEERRWNSARRGRSRRGAGSGYGALLHGDLRRVLRTPGLLPLAALLLIVPYAGALVLPAAAVPALTAVAAWAVASRAATGLRTVARSAPLRRSLGGADRLLVAVHLVAPLVAVSLWTAAALPALVPANPLAAVLLPVGAVVVAERGAARRAPDFGAALFDTGFGAVPVDAVRQALTVPALLAVLAAAQLLLAG